MKAKFVNESIESFLEPMSKADIIGDLSKLSKAELGDKLILASENGHKDIVQMLLDAGADVNVKGNGGRTALMYASAKGHKDVATILRKHDAKE